MKITIHKTIFLLPIIAVTLSACTKTLEVNETIINEAFEHLSVDVSMMIANDRIDNDIDPKYDLIEMVDAGDMTNIYMFSSIVDELRDIHQQRMMYITPEYIYAYEDDDMSRIDNPYTITSASYYADILMIYTSLFDLDSLSLAVLRAQALSITDPSLTKTNNRYTLKGPIETMYPLGEGELFLRELVYTDTNVLMTSLSRRYAFESTPQKSNFISGVEYSFGETALPSFPPLEDFGF